MDDKVQIQILFSRITEDGTVYRDALYYSLEKYGKLTPAELEAAKQARVDNWQKAISTTPPEVPVAEQLDSIDTQIDMLTQQKQELLDTNPSEA